MDFVVAVVNESFAEIDSQVPYAENRAQRVLRGLRRMAERDANARHELRGTKRLREVVVCPGVERFDFLRLLAACGDDDDGRGVPLAQALRDLEAVEVRQPEVEQHEIRRVGGGLCEALAARLCLDDVV